MGILDIISARRSVRSYTSEQISDELLYKVLNAGRLAPSACNYQSWQFIVIKEREHRLRLSKVYNREWFYNAPVILCVCCNRNESWHRKDGKDFGDIDIAITVDHITLAAQEEGLGTCWIGNFDPVAARELLQLPAHIDPIVFTPLGFPQQGDHVAPKNRKKIEDILHFETFGGDGR
ncbi:MAG TPA: nitroreductase family protein [Chitinispirillaceae bacterium]|nr:nitroreductase family protein [Chitinispirillaceae bacterium]